MAHQIGENQIQYKCKKCMLISPHQERCFRCGSLEKTKVVVPEIIKKTNKGQGVAISIR
jgi:hypothetical protein